MIRGHLFVDGVRLEAIRTGGDVTTCLINSVKRSRIGQTLSVYMNSRTVFHRMSRTLGKYVVMNLMHVQRVLLKVTDHLL